MTQSTRMPALFIGHGNPMNAIRDTPWSQAWAELGRRLPRPRAVLAISAHWYVPYTAVTAMAAPRTIHDFHGFPYDLYQMNYPAPGDPALAARVAKLLAPLDVVQADDATWGLDHGTWSVLHHLLPFADIPVVQLSIDRTADPIFHYELGQHLRTLREEGVLVFGSGNVVHNLRAYAWKDASAQFDWAMRFEDTVRTLVKAGEHEQLINYRKLGRDATLSVPTPDHYLPLLYVLGASHPGEAMAFPTRGTEGGAISMLSVQFGGPGAA